MSGNIKITLDKYLNPCGLVLEQDKLTLDDWYLLEAVIQEANKLSGGNFEEWKKITGRIRAFDSLIVEVEKYIKQLGGKVKAERERAKSLWEVWQEPPKW